jgi:hypothetical protein
MSNGNNIRSDRDPKFSFGTRELREARRAEARERAESRAVEERAHKTKKNDADTGFDPYNSSGSFDRRKNWERVGKR